MRNWPYKTRQNVVGRSGWWVLMAVGVGLVFVLFAIKTRALEARAYVKKLEHKLEQERAEVRMINAEIAHLESPERLKRLAVEHLDLQRVKAKQVLSLEGAAVEIEKKHGKKPRMESGK